MARGLRLYVIQESAAYPPCRVERARQLMFPYPLCVSVCVCVFLCLCLRLCVCVCVSLCVCSGPSQVGPALLQSHGGKQGTLPSIYSPNHYPQP